MVYKGNNHLNAFASSDDEAKGLFSDCAPFFLATLLGATILTFALR